MKSTLKSSSVKSIHFPPRKVGFSLIELLVVLAIVGILAGLILAGVQNVRSTAGRAHCANNLHQIALAMQQYENVHGSLPPGVSHRGGKDPYLFMAWGARLLPYIEQNPLWATTAAAFAQNPDFQANPPHIGYSLPLSIYTCRADVRDFAGTTGTGAALSSYLGVSGAVSRQNWDGILFRDSNVRRTDISDGTSNTIMIGERPPSANLDFGWWYGGWGQDRDGSSDSVLSVRERAYGPRYFSECPIGPYPFQSGTIANSCDQFHFWSLHPGGANFAFADGSVHFLRYSARDVMPALATRAGDEVVAIPD